jgi:hypothetical protein
MFNYATVILQMTVLKSHLSKMNSIVRKTANPGDCEEREKLADAFLSTVFT